jgi:hypothetical protein
MFDEFPSIDVCTRLGIYSYDGSNPVDILSIYREALVNEEVTLDELLNSSDLNTLLMKECPSVRWLPCYDRVFKNGGIHPNLEPQFECQHCLFCTVHDGPMCSNCGLSVK